MCVTLRVKACVLIGGRESERERHRRREKYPEIQVSCEASAGVEGYTCRRPGASLSPSVVFLSLSFRPAGRAGASQPPTQPPPPGSRPVQPSHAWPSLGIHSGCFLFIASTPLSLSLFSLSICHSTPTTSHLHVFLFTFCPINQLYFLMHIKTLVFHHFFFAYFSTPKLVLNLAYATKFH